MDLSCNSIILNNRLKIMLRDPFWIYEDDNLLIISIAVIRS